MAQRIEDDRVVAFDEGGHEREIRLIAVGKKQSARTVEIVSGEQFQLLVRAAMTAQQTRRRSADFDPALQRLDGRLAERRMLRSPR